MKRASPDDLTAYVGGLRVYFRWAKEAGVLVQKALVSPPSSSKPRTTYAYRVPRWVPALCDAMRLPRVSATVAGRVGRLNVLHVCAIRAVARLPEERLPEVLTTVVLAADPWRALAHFLAEADCLFCTEEDRPLMARGEPWSEP